VEKTTLEKFYTAKFMRVPAYQRDYAWAPSNVDDLWTDVNEALSTKGTHYLGTFILARRKGEDTFDIVDGQQRLTTLTMLLRALVDKLPPSESVKRVVFEDRYIRSGGRFRLTLLGENQEFFLKLIAAEDPAPNTGGQRRLQEAFARIRDRVDDLASGDPKEVGRWIEGIEQLYVLEFVEEDEGSAIRTFETVNDRGRPLATLDKVKSFLIYTSSRYLGGFLDSELQSRFGRIFRSFDLIKEAGKGLDIQLIARDPFTEDSVLRYHFLAYPSDYHDYRYTAEEVLGQFLKPFSKHLRASSAQECKEFIDDYSKDLAKFFEALASLLRRASEEPAYFKVFTNLPLSAQMYPLITRLEMLGLLAAKPLTGNEATLLDMIETADLRVYKTRGTTPEKDLAQLASESRRLPATEIAQRLGEFVEDFMDDSLFRHSLDGNVYEQNEGARHILLEWDEDAHKKQVGSPSTMPELVRLKELIPTIDHILAQSPTFSTNGRGFADLLQYGEQIHRLGNLTVVERAINSAAQQKTPEQKAQDDRLYKASTCPSTRQLGISLTGQHERGEMFGKDSIEKRTTSLIDFCLRRWPLWDGSS